MAEQSQNNEVTSEATSQKEKPTTEPQTECVFIIGKKVDATQWEKAFAENLIVYFRFQEDMPRLQVERRLGPGLDPYQDYRLGWCPKGSYLPAVHTGWRCSRDVLQLLRAGGLADDNYHWPQELRVLFPDNADVPDDTKSALATLEACLAKMQDLDYKEDQKRSYAAQKEKPIQLTPSTVPTMPTMPTMPTTPPDNCFGIGHYWSPQVWAALFTEDRTAAFLEYREDGPRIFVEWTKKSGSSTLTLGWCPPQSWIPTEIMPSFLCSDVRSTLYAGGVGAPEKEWGVQLRTLFTAHRSAKGLPDLLFAWADRMIKRAQAAGVDVAGWEYPKTKAVELKPKPEPAEPEPAPEPSESEPLLAPLPRGYEWELNLSNKKGRLNGSVTVCRQNGVGEDSHRAEREVMCLTFNLDNEDLCVNSNLLQSIVKSGVVEQMLGQALNLAQNAHSK